MVWGHVLDVPHWVNAVLIAMSAVIHVLVENITAVPQQQQQLLLQVLFVIHLVTLVIWALAIVIAVLVVILLLVWNITAVRVQVADQVRLVHATAIAVKRVATLLARTLIFLAQAVLPLIIIPRPAPARTTAAAAAIIPIALRIIAVKD